MRLLHIDHIDEIKCSACEKCVHICPEDCFEITELNGKIIAKFISPEKCTYCGECLVVCEEEAIMLNDIEADKIYEVTKPENCSACESCVQLSKGKGFEMVEKDGKIFAKRLDDNTKNVNSYFACPNIEINPKKHLVKK